MGFLSMQRALKLEKTQCMTVAWGVDIGVLKACQEALIAGFLHEVVLTGPVEQTKNLAEQAELDLTGFSWQEASTPQLAARQAVQLIRDGRCKILMKGHLATSVLLRAVLHKEEGLKAQGLLSHVALIELPEPRLALLTDGGMNIRPDLAQKTQILDNAIKLARLLNFGQIRVAVLTALETVNPQMSETVDAAALSVMAQRKQFGSDVLVDGPLAFDNAYSLEAALQKGLQSPVAGQANIFLAPDLSSGNILYKAFSYVGGLATAGLVYGASCPIILASRSDSIASKLNSIAAACVAGLTQEGR